MLARFLNSPEFVAAEYLDEFTDPSEHYAFATYDQAAVHDGPLTAAGFLMANLLSLQLGWRDVIPLSAGGNITLAPSP